MNPSLPFDLLGFDLDGTTIPSDGEVVPQRTMDALSAAHDAGTVVTVVTGRPLDMLGFISGEPWLDYLVTLNGALARQGGDFHTVYGLAFEPAQVDSILKVADAEGGGGWFAFQGDCSLMQEDVLSYMMHDLRHTREQLESRFPASGPVDRILLGLAILLAACHNWTSMALQPARTSV